MALGIWNLLDDGKYEKVYSYVSEDNGVFITSKLCTLYSKTATDVTLILEHDLEAEVSQLERIATRSFVLNNELWHFLTYKVITNATESFCNFCFTIKNDVGYLCKSSYDSADGDNILCATIKDLLTAFDFTTLLITDSVLHFDAGDVLVQAKHHLRLNEHSSAKALFYTDADSYCVVTMNRCTEEELLHSTKAALISLTDDTHRFEMLTADENEKGAFSRFSVISGTEVVGSVTVQAMQIDNNFCISMLYYSTDKRFYDMNSLFELQIRRT